MLLLRFTFVRANDFLEFCTQRYLLPSASALDIDSTDTGERLVLDLGCGNGRDAVYMAQNLPLGTRVVGVDNHSYALERGAGLAEQWLESASSREGRGGDGAGSIDGGSQEGVRPSRQAAENYLEGRGEETSDTGDDGKAERECPDMRGGACEWLLTDLRKEGSLTGLRASIVHGHRFKCEQLLPLLRDDVRPASFFLGVVFVFPCPTHACEETPSTAGGGRGIHSTLPIGRIYIFVYCSEMASCRSCRVVFGTLTSSSTSGVTPKLPS